MARLRARARPLSFCREREECVSWVGLLVFLCEMRQVLSCPRIGLAGVSRVLAAPREVYLPAALSFEEEYRRSSVALAHPCHLVRLFLTSLAAVDSAPASHSSSGVGVCVAGADAGDSASGGQSDISQLLGH